MGKILWLASYPKSGRTWMRAFLQNYLHEDEADINSLETAVASYRLFFDDLLGVETSNLTEEEIQRYRSASFSFLAQEAPDHLILKVHDAFEELAGGRLLFPAEASCGVIYILRNPLDVAVSYAAFAGEPVEKSIRDLADPNLRLGSRQTRLYTHVHQNLLSWSRHVLSWVDQQSIPVHLVRYEDMLYSPLETFEGVIRFAGFQLDPARLQKAIEAASFGNLQKQEQEKGFRERPPTSPAFFRQGRAGSWREVLTDAQRDQIIFDQREVMQRFGYLTQTGEIVY